MARAEVVVAWMASLLALILSANAANPALVTHTVGEVTHVKRGAPAGANAVPYLVGEGDVLTLAKGSRAVVLFGHSAKVLQGPGSHRWEDLMAGVADQPTISPVEAVLNKAGVAQLQPPKRGPVAVQRPVPGAAVGALSEVRWHGGPKEAEVVVRDVAFDAELWRGKGGGKVRYDGPALPPGKYLLELDGEPYPFSIASPYELEQVDAAAKAAREALGAIGVTDAPSILSVQAGALVALGLGGEALELLDKAVAKDASLAPLRDAYAEKLGVQP